MRRAINLTRGTVLCQCVEEAAGALARGKGLMGRSGLGDGCGMLIGGGPFIPVMWMHMFFMRFAIDIVFLDRADKIIRIKPGVKPWRLTAPVFGARQALEIATGAAARSFSQPGDQVGFEDL
jgi:uncharacterized membrane protein (UPF0127 family)